MGWRGGRLVGACAASLLVLVEAAAAPAGVGTPPAYALGEATGAAFPHAVGVRPGVAIRDAAGRVVVAGAVYRPQMPDGSGVVRFTAAGAGDASFGQGGAVVAFTSDSESARALAALPDGRLVVGLSGSRGSTVERLTAGGGLDATFGAGGVVTLASPASVAPSTVTGLRVLADGTTVVVRTTGGGSSCGELPAKQGAVLIDRLGPDGRSLSQVVHAGPEWQVAKSAGYAMWFGAHVYGDGSVLVTGNTFVLDDAKRCAMHEELLLRRFRADGSLDAAFASGGRTGLRTDNQNNFGLAVGGDGSIVVSAGTGGGEGREIVVRFHADGRRDKAFGRDGMATIPMSFTGRGLAVAPDGSIFIGSADADDLQVFKFGPEGFLAYTFGKGELPHASVAGLGRVAALLPDADGGATVVAARESGGEQNVVRLMRYGADGVIDDRAPIGRVAVGLPSAGALAVTSRANGDVALTGWADDGSGRVGVRVALQGPAMQTFGQQGEATVFVGERARGTAVAIDAAGRVVVGGDVVSGGQRRWLAMRFLRNGTLDRSFAAGGVITAADAGANDDVRALAALPDSRVLMLVRQAGRDLLVRMAANGTLDGTFGTGGSVEAPGPGAAGLALLPGGGAVVADDDLSVAWVDSDGSVVRRSARLTAATAAGIAVQSDESVIVAGTTTTGLAVARVDADGSPVASFGSGGIVTRGGLDAVGVVVLRDGRIDVAVRPRVNPDLAVLQLRYTGELEKAFGDAGLARAGSGRYVHLASGGLTSGVATLPGEVIVAGTVPATRGSDQALVTLADAQRVFPVGAVLYHVTPAGKVRRVAAKATGPSWSQTAKLLAYVGEDDGCREIRVQQGENVRQITHSPLPTGAVAAGGPQWSRDGKLLAFQILDPDGTPAIAVTDAQGGSYRRIGAGYLGGWSSGHRLVYSTPNRLLRLADADTGTARPIGVGWDAQPAPRGTLLAVDRPSGRWLARQNGKLVRRLPAALARDVGWAPDGQRLAGFDHGHVVIVDLEGRERPLRAAAGADARAPLWSLDGRTIAYVNRSGDTYYLAFVLVRTGKVIGRWSTSGDFNFADPSWDATGVYIPNTVSIRNP